MSFTSGLEKQLEEYASKIEDTIQAAQDLPETGHLYTMVSPGELRVDIPHTPTAYAEYRAALGNKWRQDTTLEQGRQNDRGDVYWHFTHKELDIEFTLCLDSKSEYATCTRVQVGVKEMPIFETVCA